ncbi:MAG TPA: chemotaxis protein CheW [Gemmatimonas aurantiaca]|uniref:Chemotaxis protein CheW n=2 Tax=Gemmatimonas aurantiaca TaxID=173480 RepID=A0A3D4V552_9BACT|nr:chemotaxis protein CheW [Gemmatimonas aurantiaca]BAH38457.1 putative chemotaxis protein [Gemmatimonas aurantiaca T-27]HCT56215.1 chemotaxis protein CheW [Gemmatimonas aurantiaca]
MSSARFRSVRDIAGSGGASRLARRRARPAVERSTFVVISLGGDRMAIAVESVERVVRPFSSLPVMLYDGRQLPYADLAKPLGRAVRFGEGDQRRVLIVRDGGRRWAVPVDTVHEVHAIETAHVLPMDAEARDASVEGVQAHFERQGHDVLVVDAVRILSRTAAARART